MPSFPLSKAFAIANGTFDSDSTNLACISHQSLHFLFLCYSHSSFLLSFSLSDFLSASALIRLQLCSDVSSDIYIRYINGKDFKSRTRIKPFSKYNFRYSIWIFKHIFVGFKPPTAVDSPSPTLAIIVSSPAPPTNLSIFALTVTFALTLLQYHSLLRLK